jgi:hypothetical protein
MIVDLFCFEERWDVCVVFNNARVFHIDSVNQSLHAWLELVKLSPSISSNEN